MTIEQANEYFSSLPEGFAPAEELSAALTCLLYTSPSPRDTR